MTDCVDDHFRRWMRERFQWGTNDCCLVLADYVLDVRGVDGAAHLRGRYSTRKGCAALTRYDLDLVAVVADCAARAGLVRTNVPKRGDIGVIHGLGADRVVEIGAVCIGEEKWAGKTLRGALIVTRPEVIAAWEV